MSTTASLPGIPQNETGGAAEFFPTPPALCEAICRVVAGLKPFELCLPRPDIIEPSAGSGNFVRAARKQWPSADIAAIDVRDTSAECADAAPLFFAMDFVDFVRTSPYPDGGFGADLIIGNPPFSLAMPHIEAGMTLLADGGLLAFMLRLSFWETPGRAELMRRYPVRAFAPIVQRPSFTGNGKGDKTGVGLFVFEKDFRGRGDILEGISWR